MCVIIHLEPGFTPSYAMIEMATWNNPHGYGLILRDKSAKKLQLIKSGSNAIENGSDPKEVYDLLKDNEDLERIIHLRWKTEGDVSIENVQPFGVYSSGKRDIFLMHNGTLHDFRPPSAVVSYVNGVKQEKNERTGWSDTRIFAEDIVSPLLVRIKGEDGFGDIHDPMFVKTINKFWGSAAHNRGILISSDQEPLYLNKTCWQEISDGGQKFLASNNTYFTKLERGPEFERRKKIEEEEKKARFQDTSGKDQKSSTGAPVQKLKDILLNDKITLPINIKDLLHDVDVYTHQGLAELKNITAIEWEKFIESKSDIMSLLLHLTDEFAVLHERYQKLVSFQEMKREEKKVA